MKRRILSLLLVVAMLLSMSVTALADDTWFTVAAASAEELSAIKTGYAEYEGNDNRLAEGAALPTLSDNCMILTPTKNLSYNESYISIKTDKETNLSAVVFAYDGQYEEAWSLCLRQNFGTPGGNYVPSLALSTTAVESKAEIYTSTSDKIAVVLTGNVTEDTTVTVHLWGHHSSNEKAIDYGEFSYTFKAPKVAKIGDVEYTSLADAFDAANNADTAVTVKLLDDIKLTSEDGVSVNPGKDITVDLAGQDITANFQNVKACAVFHVKNNGKLTMNDTGAEPGKVVLNSTTVGSWPTPNVATNVFLNEGTLVINGGYYENCGQGYCAYVVDNNSNTGNVSLTVNGGTLVAQYCPIRTFLNSSSTTNNVLLTDGVFEGRYIAYIQQPSATTSSSVDFKVEGGTYNCKQTYSNPVKAFYIDVLNTAKIDFSISGGKFENTDATQDWVATDVAENVTPNADIKVSGGYYSSDKIASDFIASGYACVANTDSATRNAYPYVVKAVTTEVAEVKAEGDKIVAGDKTVDVEVKPDGEKTATTQQVVEAINTIIDNTEVTTFEETKIEKATEALKTDTVKVDNFDISKILNLVKEEAAKQYTASATANDEIGVTVGEAEAQQFTTEDVTTKITVDLTAATVETTTEEAGTSVVSATVSTMTFDVKPVATITVDKGNGETEVIKAVIPNEAITAPITFRLPVKDGWNEVRVSHNGIYKGTYFAQGETGNRYIELASNTFSYWTVENNEFEDTDAVAKTGNRYYDNLAEALKDAANGDTVTVLQNCSINEELFIANKSITLDLGGFTVDVTAPTGKTIPIHIGTKDSSTAAAGLTVKNGTINGTASGNVFGVYGMTTDSDAKRALTLDGVTMNVTGGYAVALNNNSNHGYGAEITIKNSKLTAPYVLSVNGYIQDTTGNFPKIKIENSTLKANSDQVAVYAAGYAAWDIDGSNITGGTGIYAKAGTFDISGGKIEGNGAYAAPTANGDGGDSTGDAIIMDSKKGYAGNMTMDLKGVTVSSVNGYAVHEALTDKNTTSTQSIAIDGGNFTAAVGKGTVVTSEAFDRAETTTLTFSNTPQGIPASLGWFTEFSVDYGDGVDYSVDKDHTTSRWSDFTWTAGGATADAAKKFTAVNDEEHPEIVNFATLQEGQKLIANFNVTMGTVSYKTGTMEKFETIHSGDALDNYASGQPIYFQIECGSSVTGYFTFTPHWETVEIPYTLHVKPISGETLTVEQLKVSTTDTPNYVEYGVYASVPSGTTAMAIGSYNFELQYDAATFDYASFTPADTTATVEVEHGADEVSFGKIKVGVTLNTAVTPEAASEDGAITYANTALLGTLKLKVQGAPTEETLTTTISNPVVTPKGYDKNAAAITAKNHTQHLISFGYTGATGLDKEWILEGKTPSMPAASPNTGWSAATGAEGEGWSPATATAATGPQGYHYTAHHIKYTVTAETGDPMSITKSGNYVEGGSATISGNPNEDDSWMYYEDTLSIAATGLSGNTVIRNGDFKYTIDGTATSVDREGESGFTYKIGPNKVTGEVTLSYTTTDYVTVTFFGGTAVDLMYGQAEATGDNLKAITRKGVADQLYASVNDFVKGNSGYSYNIPEQKPKAGARLVPPDALTDQTKQQWKIGTTENTVNNSTLTTYPYSQAFSADTTLTADAVNTYKVTFAAGAGQFVSEPAQVTEYYVDADTPIENILTFGTVEGKQVYDNSNGTPTLVAEPTVVPVNGYKLDKWQPSANGNLSSDITITAQYAVAKYSITASDNATFKNLTGADNSGKISMASDVTFKLMLKKNTRIESVSYTVAAGQNGTAFEGKTVETLTPDSNGVYTIPKADILGDVTVTVVTVDTVKITVKSADTDKGTVGGTTAFVVDKNSNVSDWVYTALTTTAEPGYMVETKIVGDEPNTQEVTKFYYMDGETLTEFTATTFTAEQTLYVNFVDAEYEIALDALVNTTDTTGITSKTVDDTTTYYVTHGTDTKFKLAKDANDPQIITSVTYSVEGGVQNVLLRSIGGVYTIPGDRIIGKVTVNVTTLADEVFGSETENNKISALFILRDSTMTGVEGSGAYMANVVQNGDMKILALVSEAFQANGYTTANKFFQLDNGTQLYWSDRYDAYVCWVSKTMTSADLDGFVKFDGSKTATAIVNGGDINFDNAVDSADAGIVNDALNGTRQVPTSALQLFEMDVANTSEKALVNGATIDANDVTWILKNTVTPNSVAKSSNPLWAKPE